MLHPQLTPPATRRDASSPTLDAVLDHAARLVTATLDPPLDALVSEHLAGGGKHTRARLAIEAAAALQVDAPDAVVGLAAACELLHNATLVHDDIQDGDRLRRGRLTLWARHGVDQAINAGDALLLLPIAALEHATGLDDARRWQLTAALTRRALRTASGQTLEMSLDSRIDDASTSCWALYQRAAGGKSGPLLALPFEGAALLAGERLPCATALGDAIEPLGLLYQIHDDVAGLYTPDHAGRARGGSDLERRRITALVATHLDRFAPPARPARLDTLATSDPAALATELAADGTLAAVLQRADALATAMLDAPALTERPALRAIVDALALRLRQRLRALANEHRAELTEPLT